MRRLALAIAAVVAAAVPASALGQTGAAYLVPRDNPFVATPGAAPEVYAYGMRNPYRWSFDRLTGDMVVGDVGLSTKEEVTFLPRARSGGANLGWNCLEGTSKGPGNCLPPNYFPPAFDYVHPAGGAVIGGYVVRDPALPSFQGRYLYTDLANGEIMSTTLGFGTASPRIDTSVNIGTPSSFGEDGVGHLYAVSLGGPVYRLGESAGKLTASSIGSFSSPTAVAAPPGDPDRLFVVERGGTVKLRAGGVNHDFLDISSSVSTDGERGLLALAAAPDYARSGLVYVFYTDKGGDLRLDEFRRSSSDPNRADPGSRRSLLTIEHSAQSNHNGGQLLFGADGYLYLSIGDGGTQGDPEGDAQNLGNLLGKIIRIDPTPESPAVALPPAPATVLPDTVAPRLRIRVQGRQRVLKQRGVIAYGRSNEAGSIALDARLRIGRRSYKLRYTRRPVAANERLKLRARLTPRASRALRRALRHKRAARVRVALRGRDRAGNRSRLARATIRVRR